MRKFNVTVTRTAYENAVLEVEADDQEAAEERLNELLDAPKRCGIDELAALPGVRLLTTDINGDQESSWEILDAEESALP